MRQTIPIVSLLILSLLAGTAGAVTSACAHQSTVGASACGWAGTFSGGDGSCSSTGSWHGGGMWLGAGVAGTQRGVAFDNSCYAYAYEGTPYEGSQVAVHAWEAGPDGYQDRGAYLNTGVVHAPDGDHPYCYVAQIDEHGEDQDGIRLDCPVMLRVPVLLSHLP